MDVSKAIDKAAGAEREVIGVKHADKYPNGPGGTGFHGGPGEYSQVGRPPEPLTAPATDDAARWQGWGTALKPAHEPIVVARKPLTGTVAANVLEHGTGALNIDACRVSMGTEYDPSKVQRQQHADGAVEGAFGAAALVGTEIPTYNPQGRWPANLVLTHHADCIPSGTSTETVGGGAAGTSGFAAGYESGDGFVGRDVPTVVWDCHPECPVAVLDGQSGTSTGAVGMRQHASGTNSVYGKFDRTDASTGHAGTKDFGGASRYFTQTEWNPDLDGPSFHYVAKPAKKERNLGLNLCRCDKHKEWANEDQQAPPPADTDNSPQRATAESGTPTNDDTEWNTSSSGSKPTDQSPKDTTFTISTTTNLTTESPTSPLSMPSPINDSTQGANYATDNGGNRATSVENSNPSPGTIGTSVAKGGPSTGDADRATSAQSSKQSNSGVACSACGGVQTGHPTVKPVALMRHLVRLVTPLGGTVLDPFTGSGTTGMAAMLEGCNFVGIEQSADYADNLARPRIEQARRMAEGPPPAPSPSQSPSPAPDPDQPSLFD